MQDAYVRALQHWPVEGTPDAPERWLARVAHNAMVDSLRRDARTDPLDGDHRLTAEGPSFDADDEIRLMFLCCDPVLPRAAQIALVLNVAFGLTARQIAAAFLSDERTVAQRIVRAKQRLRDAGIAFEVPDAASRPTRLDAVLDVLYVVFSEGFVPTDDVAPFDATLCHEALRLVRLVSESAQTSSPRTYALRALMCLHASRLPARLGVDGGLLLMPEQDRARWDHALIDEGFTCLSAAASGDELSRFHIEAAIAACHATATTYVNADWPRIVALYDALRERWPSLVVDVNRALAVAMRSGARAGLDELDAIPEREVLGRYPYALAAYADLHASLGNLDEACAYLDRALEHQASPAQSALLRRKRAGLALRQDGSANASSA